MGLAMAKNIIAGGFPLTGFDLREERRSLLETAGGKPASSPAEVGDLTDDEMARAQALVESHGVKVSCVSRHNFVGMLVGQTEVGDASYSRHIFNGGGSQSWFGGRGPSKRAGVSAEWGGSPRGRGLLRGVGNRRLFAGFPRGCGGRHPFAGIQAGVGGGSPEGRLRGDRRPHPRQPRHRQQAASRLNPRPLAWL
jgi:hypothetical protein